MATKLQTFLQQNSRVETGRYRNKWFLM